MARVIQTEIKRVLADEILFGRLREGGRVEIDARGGALVFDYAPLQESVTSIGPALADPSDAAETADGSEP